ncbi:MAG: PhzF family phenazine biosynthesis protein [Gammaproteobacteria bacterium]|nr:PhzF family phenazine biosynthesis protein [Gammaproteobacteria bacterium]
MDNQYYIADIFTGHPFAGAQIAVVPRADGLDERQMQLLARELNLSETVFVMANAANRNHRRIRIFSPTGESAHAGHPIIAAAYVLAASGELDLAAEDTPLSLQQKTGVTAITVSSSNGKPDFVQFTQQVASVIDRFAPTPQELAELLSIRPEEIDSRVFSVRLVSCGFPYLIVPVHSYATVRRAQFNYRAWGQSTAPQTAAQEILLFSGRTPHADANFNARLLGPDIGIHDDPPVGSAMPAFAAYLASHEHIQLGTHTFAVDRGDDQSRRSVLNLEMDHRNQALLTLRLGGQATIVAEGRIRTP